MYIIAIPERIRVKGLTRGLCRTPCMVTPASTAMTIRGNRKSQTMVDVKEALSILRKGSNRDNKEASMLLKPRSAAPI